MQKKVFQYRYYGDSNTKNYPQDISSTNLCSGAIFEGKIIKQIGVQTMPGVEFYLNAAKEPIIVGSTGIYELDVDNIADITALSFSPVSIDMINNGGNSSFYLIVDILYEEVEEVK